MVNTDPACQLEVLLGEAHLQAHAEADGAGARPHDGTSLEEVQRFAGLFVPGGPLLSLAFAAAVSLALLLLTIGDLHHGDRAPA